MARELQIASDKVHPVGRFEPTNVMTRKIANPDPQNTGPRP
jgi:hypothetical protein